MLHRVSANKLILDWNLWLPFRMDWTLYLQATTSLPPGKRNACQLAIKMVGGKCDELLESIVRVTKCGDQKVQMITGSIHRRCYCLHLGVTLYKYSLIFDPKSF